MLGSVRCEQPNLMTSHKTEQILFLFLRTKIRVHFLANLTLVQKF